MFNESFLLYIRDPPVSADDHNGRSLSRLAAADPAPVDARAVLENLGGFGTMFYGSHHFCPEDAAWELQHAVDQRQPIDVLEFVRRAW